MTTASGSAPYGNPVPGDGGQHGRPGRAGHLVRRLSTETKGALKTTEFYAFVAMVLGVLLAAWAVGHTDGHTDYFRADLAWVLLTILTVGYMISRGLAKSGSREPYDDRPGSGAND